MGRHRFEPELYIHFDARPDPVTGTNQHQNDAVPPQVLYMLKNQTFGYRGCESAFSSVRRIHKFLGHPDPLVRETDRDPCIVEQK